MKTDEIVDSKVTIMTDLGGEKSTLLLKNETEIEAFKEQLRIGSVSQQRELLIAFLENYTNYKNNTHEGSEEEIVDEYLSSL